MLKFKIDQLLDKAISEAKHTRNTVALRQSQIINQLNRLTDIFVEGAIEKDVFEERRLALQITKSELEQESKSGVTPTEKLQHKVSEFFEQLESVADSQNLATDTEKVKLLKSVTSNRTASPENVDFKPRKPWQQVQDYNAVMLCGHERTRLRTETGKLARYLFKYFKDLGP